MSYWKWAASPFKIATFTVAELCRRIGDQSVDQSITTNVNRDKSDAHSDSNCIQMFISSVYAGEHLNRGRQRTAVSWRGRSPPGLVSPDRRPSAIVRNEAIKFLFSVIEEKAVPTNAGVHHVMLASVNDVW